MNTAMTNPSSAGDIIGFSCRLARDNARFLIRTLLYPSLVELVGKVIMLIGVNALINAGQGNMFLVAGGIFTIAIGGVIGLGAEFFLTMRQLAIFRMYAGYDSDFNDAYKYVWKKKFQLLAAVAGTNALLTILIFFWSIEIGVSVALMVNKSIQILGFIAACFGIIMILFSMLWSAIPIVLMAPALVIEQRPFSQMISRVFKMSFKHMLRASLFILLLSVVIALLSSVLNLPPTILSMVELATTYLNSHSMAKAPNLAVQIIASVWRSGANMVLSPMVFFAFGFFYIDLCMRTEGFDISRRLELMSKRPVEMV